MVFLVTAFLASPLSDGAQSGLFIGPTLPYQAAFAFSAALAVFLLGFMAARLGR